MRKSVLLFTYILIFVFIQSKEYKIKKNILILHSYSEDYLWTKQIQKGINKSIKPENSNYKFFVEYMDAKKYNDELSLEKYDIQFTKKYQSYDLDLIVPIDDFAHKYIVKKKYDFFKDIPIISAGINSLEESYYFTHDNHYLMLEEPDYRANLALAIDQNPNARKLYLITDISITGQNIKKNINSILEKSDYDLEIEWLDDYEFSELVKKVASLKKNEIIMYYVFFRDNTNKVFSYDAVLPELSKVTMNPIYVNWSFYIDTGAFGGNLYCGEKMGEKLFENIEKITKNLKIPKVIDGKQKNNFLFDYKLIKTKDFHFKYPQDSSFYNNMKQTNTSIKEILVNILFNIFIGSGILLIIFIILL